MNKKSIFHFHKWNEEVDRQFMETVEGSFFGLKVPSGGEVTLITQQCECGNYKQFELKGHIRRQ